MGDHVDCPSISQHLIPLGVGDRVRPVVLYGLEAFALDGGEFSVVNLVYCNLSFQIAA